MALHLSSYRQCAFSKIDNASLSIINGGNGRQARSNTVVHGSIGRRRVLASASRPSDIVLGWPDNYPKSEKKSNDMSNVDKIDVLGLGQAMIDFGATVEDEWLSELEVAKGSRKLISVKERTQILGRLSDEQYQISAGGSLSNTLIDLARLSQAQSSQSGKINIAMAGLVGSDALGAFYRSQMEHAGVSVIAPQEENIHTGTVIVLTTEDAQRTMLSYLGTQKEVDIDPVLEDAIRQTSVLVIEGYVWELPNAYKTITAAVRIAKEHGVRVAMTAGDCGVVERHSEEIWECIGIGIDILFTNSEEAATLARHRPVKEESSVNRLGPAASVAEAAALCLGPYCPIVCVTDGSAGSIIASLGQLSVIPPHWTQNPPIDTCGAGDAWAAGLLYGLLRGQDIVGMGHLAARSASAVIAKLGPTLCPDAASSAFPSSTGTAQHANAIPFNREQQV